MSFRPYPRVDRAIHQLDRHCPPASGEAPEAFRPLVASFARLRENTRRAAEQGFGMGTYRLSTRQPSGLPH